MPQGAPRAGGIALAERGLRTALFGPSRHEAAEADVADIRRRFGRPDEQRAVGALLVHHRRPRDAGVTIARLLGRARRPSRSGGTGHACHGSYLLDFGVGRQDASARLSCHLPVVVRGGLTLGNATPGAPLSEWIVGNRLP